MVDFHNNQVLFFFLIFGMERTSFNFVWLGFFLPSYRCLLSTVLTNYYFFFSQVANSWYLTFAMLSSPLFSPHFFVSPWFWDKVNCQTNQAAADSQNGRSTAVGQWLCSAAPLRTQQHHGQGPHRRKHHGEGLSVAGHCPRPWKTLRGNPTPYHLSGRISHFQSTISLWKMECQKAFI